jgi:ubiquinone biosynthesis protein COQ4
MRHERETTDGMSLKEAWLVGRAIVRTLADSERTGEIQRVEEITGRRHYRRLMRALADSDEGRELLRDRPELDAQHVDFDMLRRLPPDSLGGAYVRHLDANGLSADSQATRTTYIDDPDMAYWMRRFRQCHDVWHALIGLGINGHEEVLVHAFSWGQLRLPVSALVVFFGSLKHMVLEARWRALRHALAEAYRNGRDAEPLLPVYWERMWALPLDEVRRQYRVRPCSPELVHR